MPRRLFLAIDLPERIAAEASAVRGALGARCPGARWTREENLHATVLFMGDVEEDRLEVLTAAFRESLSGLAPFTLAARGFTSGPPGRHPTMLWIGFDDSAEFRELAATAHAAASRALDLPPSRSDSAPHVTLARFRDGLPHPCAAAAARVAFEPSFVVGSATLYGSRLSQDGPDYEIMDKFLLNGHKS